jgi:hypothetical protein
MLKRIALIAAVVLTATDGRLNAQSLEPIRTPIDVRVVAASASAAPSPGRKTVVPAGATVRITGSSVQTGKSGDGLNVRIEVKPASGSAAKLSAPVAANGTFTVNFSATTMPGEYAVTATTPDAKNSATTSFTVVNASTIGSVFDTLAGVLEKGNQQAIAATGAAATAVANKTPFEGQEKVKGDLAKVQKQMSEYPASLQKARTAWVKLGEITRQYPAGIVELEPIISTAADLADQADRADDAFANASKNLKDSGLCDSIDAAAEALGAMSLWYDLQGRMFTKMAQLATDKFLPDKIYNASVAVDKRDPAQKFSLGESLKAVGAGLSGTVEAAGGKGAGGTAAIVDFVKQPQNLLLDTAQYLSGLAFDKYCERYQGPFDGTFSVDATINGPQKFWGYTTTITGNVMLRYEKKNVKPGEVIPMSGEMEGNATFSMYEDLMAFNNFNRQFVVFRFLTPPLGFSANAQQVTGPLGKIARMATPAYFRVPIKGELAGKQLKITVGDASLNDFTDLVKGRALYVMVTPAVPIPQPLAANLPVQNGQFMLSRAMRTTGTLPVTVATKGKMTIQTAEQSFTRQEVVSNGEVTVNWKLHVKACNPECP